MRTVTARIFDYSLDGFIAEEGTAFFDFCRDLPDDPAHADRTRDLYEGADVHIMGRKHYQDAAQYFPGAVDHPYADALGAEIEKLRVDGDGDIVAHGGVGFWRSLIRLDLIDEYRLSAFPYLAGTGTRLFEDLGQAPALELVSATAFGNGITELAYRRIR